MPIYEFHCQACARDFEELVRRRDEKVACPACGSSRVKKLLSGFAVTGEARQGGGGGSCGHCKPKAGGCKGCSCH